MIEYDALNGIWLKTGYYRHGKGYAIKQMSDLDEMIVRILCDREQYLLPGEIKFIRLIADMSEKELGEALGLTFYDIQKWENVIYTMTDTEERLFRLFIKSKLGFFDKDLPLRLVKRSKNIKLEFDLGSQGWKLMR